MKRESKKSSLRPGNGPAFLLPQLKTTEQRCHVVTILLESACRTGRRLFAWSRTVRDDHLVARKLVRPLANLIKRHQLRPANMTHVIHVFIAHVQDDNFSLLHQLVELCRSDASDAVSPLSNRRRRRTRLVCGDIRVAISSIASSKA